MQGTKPAQTIDLIAYDCGWGCGDYGCQDGPEKARLDQIAAALHENNKNTILTDLKLRSLGNREDFKTKHDTYPMTVDSVTKLANRCHTDTQNGVLPFVFGGDHSSAIGTWSGVISALDAEGDFGLIWVDAHMDAHTPETSEQGKWGGWWHGMPVASLTGNGTPDFTQLCSDKPKINPAHIVLIGIRSFEPGEEEYIKQHGITCYTSDDVEKLGAETIIKSSLDLITQKCSYFGVSIDLDGFDPQDAPGVGTPEQNGIRSKDAILGFQGLCNHPKFKGLEIVEYNPHNGSGGKTVELIHNLTKAFS